MENDLDCWLKKVEKERLNVYELSYFTMPQILTLREELGLFSVEKSTIRSNVMNLLHGVSKEINPKKMKDVIEEIESNQMKKTETVDDDETIVEQRLTAKNSSKTTNNKNYPSDNESVSIIQQNNGLEEQNNEIINCPRPSITVDNLTDEEKSLYDDLQGMEYTDLLILFGIEEYRNSTEAKGETMTDEVTDWCMEHSDDYTYPETDIAFQPFNTEETIINETMESLSDTEQDISDDSEHESISDNDSIDMMMEEEPTTTTVKEISEDTPLLEFPTEYDDLAHIVNKPPLDKNHPIVEELRELKYPLQQAIEAAATTDDIGEAIEYLQRKEKEGPKAKVEQETDFEM